MFALISGLAVVVVVGVAWIWLSAPVGAPASTVASTAAAPTRDDLKPISRTSIQRYPHVVFQSVIRDAQYGQAALVPLDAPAEMRVYTGLVCERISFAAEHGICLNGDNGADVTYYARLFGSDFVPTSQLQLDGSPTFATVSPDGTLAAASVLLAPVSEESELPPSKTVLIDTSTGSLAADLDSFALVRDGELVAHTSVDLWGVTFKADGNGFFASIRLNGNVFLVEGSLQARTITVREPGISAPSLSSAGDRIAYARLISSDGSSWRFHVLNLNSRVDTELAETRGIDDQMVWIDDNRVAYDFSPDTWTVNADGSGRPAPFLFGALSASAVRP